MISIREVIVFLPVKQKIVLDGVEKETSVYLIRKVKEEWKELIFKGKPSGYKISNLGDVKKPDGTPSPLYYDKDGYTRFCLYIPKNNEVYKNDKRIAYPYKTHRAVAELFVHNPNPEKYTLVRHLNDMPDCNFAINLEWGDPQMNMDDKKRAGRSRYLKGEEKVDAIFTEKEVHKLCDVMYNKNITSSSDIIKYLGYTKKSKKFIRQYKTLIANVKRKHCWKFISDQYTK